ncbi:MAG: hypothetical protein KDA32_01195 [Phycisphaerales bacterium]|nr:hypothetical protein [Phycisphaerales bacterium]
MTGSLRALMARLIDYAGLFPPASLDLETTVQNFVEYTASADAWMLGRLICPVARFEALAPLIASGPRVSLSALCGQADTPSEWSAQVVSAMRSAGEFVSGHNASIDAVETRMPMGPRFAIREALREVLAARSAGPLANAPIFVEIARDEQWVDTCALIVSEIADAKAGDQATLGFKLRCGGVTPDAFPTSEQIAIAIDACAHANVPIKFTAGLHHPLRHFNDGVGCDMHGFINVFTAALMAFQHGRGRDTLVSILESRDARAFEFSDAALRFADLSVTTKDIAALRSLVTSYGSCSFDEPRDDLATLGWR